MLLLLLTGPLQAATLVFELDPDDGPPLTWTIDEVDEGSPLPTLVAPTAPGEAIAIYPLLVGSLDGAAVLDVLVEGHDGGSFHHKLWWTLGDGEEQELTHDGARPLPTAPWTLRIRQEGALEGAGEHRVALSGLVDPGGLGLFVHQIEERGGHMAPAWEGTTVAFARCEGDHERRRVSLSQLCADPEDLGQPSGERTCNHLLSVSDRGRRLEESLVGTCTWTAEDGAEWALDYDLTVQERPFP